MDFTEVAVVAGLVVAYSLVAGRLDRSPITAPMVFCLGGLVLGSEVLNVVDLHIEDSTVGLIAEITLVLVLFSDAARIDVRELRMNSSLPVRLLGVGFPLTVAAGLGSALLVFPGLSVWEAGLLAVILTPTDAALGQAVVSSQAVPLRIRQALNVESGLNDGLAVPLLAIMLAGALGDGSGGASFWVRFIGEQIGYGIGIGLVCGLGGGYLVRVAMSRGLMNHTYGQIAPLSIAVLAFAGASAVDGNGFLAAFIAGSAFGTWQRHGRPCCRVCRGGGSAPSGAVVLPFRSRRRGSGFRRARLARSGLRVGVVDSRADASRCCLAARVRTRSTVGRVSRLVRAERTCVDHLCDRSG